jgi:hypothetical protein
MTDDDSLRPADPADLADTLAFALKFSGRKRVHDADEFMARMVADRLVRHLERCGYGVMKKPPLGGHSGLAAGPLNKG